MMADGLWPGVSWVLGSSGLRKADECIAEVGDRLQSYRGLGGQAPSGHVRNLSSKLRRGILGSKGKRGGL